MKKEFFVERSGQTFVLYAGLLDEAHTQGLKSITTSLLQIPNEENKMVAICQAIVEMQDGKTFSGIGDASPTNVARPMQTAIIRMAETRAKARALRDAVNVGAAALEELDGGNHQDNDPTPIRASAVGAASASASKPTAKPQLPTTQNFNPAGNGQKPEPTKESLLPAFLKWHERMEGWAPPAEKVLANPEETVESMSEFISETAAWFKANPNYKPEKPKATATETTEEIPF